MRIDRSLPTGPGAPVLRRMAPDIMLPRHNCRRGRQLRAVARAVAYIEDNPAAPLDLETLAGIACLSPFHFARVFKRCVGRSVHQQVLVCRLEAACRLLVGTQRPIAEIALDCGFSSQSHLTTALGARHGLTPGQLRRLAQAGSDAA